MTSPVVQLLRELVAIPSVHPEADAGESRAGEAALGSWIEARFRSMGADVSRVSLSPTRDNVVAIFEPGTRALATVVFAPHLDTVGVTGMDSPFALKASDGRLYGRGACDTKGPMAALLTALAAWSRRGSKRRVPIRWVVAATVGEEQGGLGARALVKHGLRADFAVALEPTDLRVVYAAKGFVRYVITVQGKAAHGATPERGENAVFKALPLLTALRDELAPWLRRQRHPELGSGSLNLGFFQGGTELNLVPGSARLGLDLRVPSVAVADELKKRAGALVQRHEPRARLICHSEGPALFTPKNNPWARQLRGAGRGWSTANWFCDANVFSGAGIPAVAFGPGSIRQAHRVDEYIVQRELEAGVSAFSRFLVRSAQLLREVD